MAASEPETGPRGSITGRFSGVVYDQIIELITSGVFPTNSRLPSEAELSTRFGASRPVVREALQQLRDDGIVSSRQGSGSYVRRSPDAAVLQFVPVGSLADVQRCFEFRVGLEPATAALAAERCTLEDIERIRTALAALERSIAEDRLGVEEDCALHEEIAQATHNQYHMSVQLSLRSHVIAGMNITRNLSMKRQTSKLRTVQQEHERVVEAIAQRDPERAATEMREHIANARRRMFEGI